MKPGSKVIMITRQSILDDLVDVHLQLQYHKDIAEGKRTRSVGPQVVLDMLLQLWASMDKEAREEFMSKFKTRVLGYCYSLEKWPMRVGFSH